MHDSPGGQQAEPRSEQTQVSMGPQVAIYWQICSMNHDLFPTKSTKKKEEQQMQKEGNATCETD